MVISTCAFCTCPFRIEKTNSTLARNALDEKRDTIIIVCDATVIIIIIMKLHLRCSVSVVHNDSARRRHYNLKNNKYTYTSL